MGRVPLLLTVAILCAAVPALAQDPQTATSLQRIHSALQSPPTQSDFVTPAWPPPERRQLGVFTLVPTVGRSEFVRVAVPVGEFVAGAGRAVSKALSRRAERKARERVHRDLQEFLARTAESGQRTDRRY